MYKVIVFDLDETLGHFVQLSVLIDLLKVKYNINLNKNEMNKLLDKLPEIFRPNLFKILKFIIKKKNLKECQKVFIYTNNDGPKSWTRTICNYIEYKLNYKLFDKIIGAYKVDNKIIEPCRTTYRKTKNDLINCTKIPIYSNICFLDDQYHNDMNDENIYYLNIKPYVYIYNNKELIEKYYNLFKPKINKNNFIENMNLYFIPYNFNKTNNSKNYSNISKIIGKQIYIFVKEFFKKNYTVNSTKKNKKKSLRITKKII